MPRYDGFAVTALGLERIAAAELDALGVRGAEAVQGGVSFGASPRELYSANVHLRTATRVVVRIGAFEAKGFRELERRAAKLPWEAFVSPNVPVSLSVTCRKSRLYHSDAVAERVASAISVRVAGAGFSGAGRADDDVATGSERAEPEQLVLVRIFRDRCTLSVDSSGARLHVRGYRLAVAKAPIRETLAAAALLVSGWDGSAPLIDPMCGSGTIPIEGALIARRIAPGLGRGFAFERWPDLDESVWRAVAAEARALIRPVSPARIRGSDRDEGAIAAAVANADRAGVGGDIEFSRRPISSVEPSDDGPHGAPGGVGWVVTNPPYGVRVGDRDRLRNLYAQFGKVVASRFPGWQVTLISADRDLDRQTRLALSPLLETSNGGIPISIMTGQARPQVR